MTPNIDRNEAPETWITAAPLDTLTVKGPGGVVVPNPPITAIPVQFHLYWAASDKDGAIAGFYVAVVETSTTQNEETALPPLPGPKPTDYHFTTRTDSTFVFTVDEVTTDRFHALYIYAVDDKGKADPTPARFIFSAIDKAPPVPVIDLAYAEGDTVELDALGEPRLSHGTWLITQPMVKGEEPKEQVPAFSKLTFRWHGEVQLANTAIVAYKYKLDETGFVEVDSSVHQAVYGDPALGQRLVTPGQKLFTLRALDQARGAGQTDRNFMMNFSPDTWWAGPDTAAWPRVSDEANAHAITVVKWPTETDHTIELAPGQSFPTGEYGGTFAFGLNGAEDSLDFRPSKRYPGDYLAKGRDLKECQRTFYEIYTDRNKVGRIYARVEGDTVHMNSWVILWNGGYDKDSEYRPRVDWTDPALNPTPDSRLSGAVLDTAGRVGSPVGFRSIIISRLTPSGQRSIPTQSAMYPIYEPASVFRTPKVGGYWRMLRAGTAYALARAEDADGGIDKTVADPVFTAENPGAPKDERRKVLVFHVDKPPVLIRTDPTFEPHTPWPPVGAPSDTVAFPSPASCVMTMNLVGDDVDPYDPSDPNTTSGTASARTILTYKITLYGHRQDNPATDTSWTYIHTDGKEFIIPGTNNVGGQVTFSPGGTTGNPFATGDMDISVQICDCLNCDDLPGSGRCVEGIDPATKDPTAPWKHKVLNQSNIFHVRYQRGTGCP